MSGRRVALLVAADRFADPGLSALRAPQADITALSELLADADLGDFEVDHLVNGTSQELRVAVSRLLAHRDPDDFCLLHVSSHGLKDASGELYLATRDTQPRNVSSWTPRPWRRPTSVGRWIAVEPGRRCSSWTAATGVRSSVG